MLPRLFPLIALIPTLAAACSTEQPPPATPPSPVASSSASAAPPAIPPDEDPAVHAALERAEALCPGAFRAWPPPACEEQRWINLGDGKLSEAEQVRRVRTLVRIMARGSDTYRAHAMPVLISNFCLLWGECGTMPSRKPERSASCADKEIATTLFGVLERDVSGASTVDARELLPALMREVTRCVDIEGLGFTGRFEALAAKFDRLAYLKPGLQHTARADAWLDQPTSPKLLDLLVRELTEDVAPTPRSVRVEAILGRLGARSLPPAQAATACPVLWKALESMNEPVEARFATIAVHPGSACFSQRDLLLRRLEAQIAGPAPSIPGGVLPVVARLCAAPETGPTDARRVAAIALPLARMPGDPKKPAPLNQPEALGALCICGEEGALPVIQAAASSKDPTVKEALATPACAGLVAGKKSPRGR